MPRFSVLRNFLLRHKICHTQTKHGRPQHATQVKYRLPRGGGVPQSFYRGFLKRATHRSHRDSCIYKSSNLSDHASSKVTRIHLTLRNTLQEKGWNCSILKCSVLVASNTGNYSMSFKYVVVVPYYERCISSSDITNIGKAIGRKDPQLLWKPVNMQRRDEVQRFRMPSLPSIMVPFHSVPSSILPQFKGPRLKCQRCPQGTTAAYAG